MARLRRRCAPSSGSSSRPLDAAETMRGMQAAKLTTGNNDDEAAVRHFVVLVETATNDVVIHDDGDDAASPYQDRKVIAAVRERLDRGVTVRRLFDNRANLRRVDELRDHPGFTVHYLQQRADRLRAAYELCGQHSAAEAARVAGRTLCALAGFRHAVRRCWRMPTAALEHPAPACVRR